MSTIKSLVVLCILALAPTLAVSATPNAPSLNVTRATLHNGLQVVVIRDRLAPVVATWLNYRVGSNDEPITGIAHAQEHMMFRGSKSLTASQFHDTTAITGGNFNADTQSSVTQYFFEMPSQYFDIALNLEVSRAKEVLDTQKLWEQERGAITQEVTQDNSDAVFRLFDKAIQHVFAGTPYANYGLGTVQSFKQIQARDLKRFYDRWYHPNNAVFVIVGDVDPQTTIRKVRGLFGKLSPKPLPVRKPFALRPMTPLTLTDQSDAAVTTDFVAYRMPGYRSPDYFATQILNDVFNSQRGALYELYAQGKAVGIYANAFNYDEASLQFVATSVPVSTSGQTAVADLKAVIEGYKKSGLPADLVEAAKQREIAQAEMQRNSISGLASLWSQTLAVENRTPDQELAGLRKVSVEDCNRVLRRYFDNATATVGIAVPKSASGGGEGGRAAEDNTVIPSEHTGLPAFAKSVLARLRVPEQTTTPTTMTLSNGLKLVVVPQTVSHSVVVEGRIASNPGLQDPPGKEGIDQIVDSLLPFGTAHFNRLEFQAELDKIAADVSGGRNFNLNVLSQHFERGVELLAEEQLHPALPADAFKIVQGQTVGELTGAVKSPDYLARKALMEALYPPGDPARRFATPQSAGAITLGDVKQQYTSLYRPDLTTIVVVGDVTPERARSAIEKSFGAWKAVGPKPNIEPSAVPNNRVAAATIPATGRIQASVTLAETLPLTRSNPDYATLALANGVLSGGFYASLLFHDLRELHGYVYGVGSELRAGKTRSEFRVTYGCDPQNVGRAQRLVIDDLTKLQRQPLSADRLTHAKALMLGSVPVARESYGGLARQLRDFVSADLPVDEDIVEARSELAATPAQVQTALAKWIRPADFVRVVTGPAGQ